MMDQYHGLGGSYLVDPATGKRSLVSRTDYEDFQKPIEPAAAEETEQPEQPANEVAEQPVTSNKEA